jgi:hypothetical protein
MEERPKLTFIEAALYFVSAKKILSETDFISIFQLPWIYRL